MFLWKSMRSHLPLNLWHTYKNTKSTGLNVIELRNIQFVYASISLLQICMIGLVCPIKISPTTNLTLSHIFLFSFLFSLFIYAHSLYFSHVRPALLVLFGHYNLSTTRIWIYELSICHLFLMVEVSLLINIILYSKVYSLFFWVVIIISTFK